MDRQYDLRGLQTSVAANLGGTIVGDSLSGGIADYFSAYEYLCPCQLESVTFREFGRFVLDPSDAAVVAWAA